MEFIPFTDILKLVIEEAKKVKNFKPLIEELASTIERLVPILQEINLLETRQDQGKKELIFLTKLMLRAKKMVHKCSQVRVYSLVKINSYTKKIKKIDEDLVKFCQLDLQLIQHRNQLRSCSVTSLHIEESPPGLEGQHRVIWESFNEGRGEQVQEDEQLSLALQDSLNMEEFTLGEAEELSSVIKESISLRRQQEEQAAKRKLEEDEQIAKNLLSAQRERIANGSSSSTGFPLDEDEEQRVLWESFMDKGKENQAQEDELVDVALRESLLIDEQLLREAIQVSISLHHQQEEQAAKRKLEEDEQIAKRLLYDQRENGSSPSTRARSEEDEEQRIIWESFKDKGKGKKVQEDEQVAIALKESMNIEDLSLHAVIQESISFHQREEQLAKRRARELYVESRRISNGLSTSSRALLDEDVQRVLWESFKT